MFCANPKCPNAGIPLEVLYADRSAAYRAARKYCSSACQRTMPRPGARKPLVDLEERFWVKVKVAGSDECWEWTGHRDFYGYGVLFKSHKPMRRYKAHRLAWELANGQPIPEGLFVLHSCDWPPCVNPAHLSVGTRGENNTDRALKGRGHHPSGTLSTSSKLTAKQVRSIRAKWKAGVTQTALAKEYPVNQVQISRIVRRVVYKDIE